MQAFDLDGNLVEITADDLLGRAIQHETDHLSGRLFIDLLGPLGRLSVMSKLREFKPDSDTTRPRANTPTTPRSPESSTSWPRRRPWVEGREVPIL